MTIIVEAVITGILSGGIYALMASGLSLIFGVMDIVNIAQGILVILGAYLSYWLEQHFQMDLFLGLFITMPIMFVLGVFLYWAVIRRIKKERIMFSILLTFAIALVLEGVLSIIFSTDLVQIPSWYLNASIQLGGFYLSYIYLFSFLLSVVLLGGLYLLLYCTKFGYGLRASMENRTAAELIGVNIDLVQSVTFGIGVALAAAGGMTYGALNLFNPASSYDLISRLLVIIVLGGMGSLRGALIGSLVMLVIGDVTSVVWSPIWSDTVFFVLLIVMLRVRPRGLFGKLEGRKQ